MDLKHLINVAAGRLPAERVLHNCRLINVLSDEIEEGVDIALTNGRIAGVGPHYEGEDVVDLAGQYVAPGFIDGHVHRINLSIIFYHLCCQIIISVNQRFEGLPDLALYQ